VVSLKSTAANLLMTHKWPGNVRELKNIAERFVLSSLSADERLPAILGSFCPSQPATGASSLQELLRQHEHLLLEQALTRHRGDVQAVMEELDLPRRTFNEKMSRYNLDRKDYF